MHHIIWLLQLKINPIYTFIPNASDAAPIIIAFIPDAHTLLIVVHGVEIGRPAPRAAWRAGACPKPAYDIFNRQSIVVKYRIIHVSDMLNHA